MTTRFHHLNLCSDNVSPLEDFYKKVLGLSESGHAGHSQVKTKGYDGPVVFLTDGTTELHLAARDLNVAFRTGQAINRLERGHLAFRSDDIDEIKRRLKELGIPVADFGTWAMEGWEQIFFYDPDGNIVEVHQFRETDME